MVVTLPIREVLDATPRARVVRLELGGRSFPYAAGQAVMVAAHGANTRRPYSIACAPEESAEQNLLELLVGLEPDLTAKHLPLDRGALVDVEGPVGRFTFPDHPTERRFLFIAGGTGVAPLRAMLRHALRIPHEHIGFLYSARTPGEFAYASELKALAANGAIELRQTITRDAASDQWAGTRGRLGRIDLAPLVHGAATLAFVCGPPPLVQDMLVALGELGVARERVRIEEWG